MKQGWGGEAKQVNSKKRKKETQIFKKRQTAQNKMVIKDMKMSTITVNHDEKSQVGLKTKQKLAFFLFTEGIPETLA